MSDEGVRIQKEITVGSGRGLSCLSMAGDYVVAAFGDSYVCYDWRRGQNVQLMSFSDAEVPRPFVQWVQQASYFRNIKMYCKCATFIILLENKHFDFFSPFEYIHCSEHQLKLIA